MAKGTTVAIVAVLVAVFGFIATLLFFVLGRKEGGDTPSETAPTTTAPVAPTPAPSPAPAPAPPVATPTPAPAVTPAQAKTPAGQAVLSLSPAPAPAPSSLPNTIYNAWRPPTPEPASFTLTVTPFDFNTGRYASPSTKTVALNSPATFGTLQVLVKKVLTGYDSSGFFPVYSYLPYMHYSWGDELINNPGVAGAPYVQLSPTSWVNYPAVRPGAPS